MKNSVKKYNLLALVFLASAAASHADLTETDGVMVSNETLEATTGELQPVVIEDLLGVVVAPETTEAPSVDESVVVTEPTESVVDTTTKDLVVIDQEADALEPKESAIRAFINTSVDNLAGLFDKVPGLKDRLENKNAKAVIVVAATVVATYAACKLARKAYTALRTNKKCTSACTSTCTK